MQIFYPNKKIGITLMFLVIIATSYSQKVNPKVNEQIKIHNNEKSTVNSILSKIQNPKIKFSLDSLILLNQNKITYVDFWATWCKPCIKEFEFSKKMHKKFTEKGVDFIYVCIDSNAENYKSIINQLNIQGKHYFIKKEESSQIRKAFGINGLPYYLLIDNDGNITDFGNTLRPSNKLTAKKIKQLIKRSIP